MYTYFIYGASGAGLKIYEVLLSHLSNIKSKPKIIFIDDNFKKYATGFFNLDVISFKNFQNIINTKKLFKVYLAIGDPLKRKKIKDKINLSNDYFPNIFHRNSIISELAQIGYGNILCQNTVIQPGCVLGSFNIFNINSVMGPLSKIGNFNTINAHSKIASESIIGNECYFGMGSLVNYRTSIKDKCIIGANTYVDKNLESNTLVRNDLKRIFKDIS